MTIRGTSAALALTLLFGCGSGSSYGDAPEGESIQVSLDITLGPPEAEVSVVVLDDREGADDLRQLAAIQLESWAARVLSGVRPCLPNDPARTSPVDHSLVVVHPSASGEARLVGPSVEPSLRWREADATPAGRLAFVNAANAAFGAVHAGAPYSPLAAAQSIVELVSGKRAPDSSAESALLASLPSKRTVKLLLLSAHEDESPGEPEAYTVNTSDVVLDSLLLPSAEPSATPPTCAASQTPSTPRFNAWRTARGVSSLLWPCVSLSLFQPAEATCSKRCVSWRPLKEDDGRATCRLLIDAATESCDPAFGWLDPLGDGGERRPQRRTEGGSVISTCEIQQLSGAALASCRESLSCSDCQPGWCATQVPDLLDDCTRGVPLPLRFSGGADVAARGIATLLCNGERVKFE
ncbi:MAG: hypothetical protein ACOY0T_17565 [Myxococcota bacterium]